MRNIPALALALLACGGGTTRPPAEGATHDTAAQKPAADTTYPAPGRGALAAHPAGPGEIGGEWRSRAAVCASPPSLQVQARGDSLDLLIVLWLPSEGPTTGAYRVLGPSDSMAAPRAARIGVQRMQYTDLAYRGLRGTVWLERLDRRATGRFDVVLDETVSHDTLRYLGVFNALPVDSAREAMCRAAPPDTASARARRPMLD